MHFFRFSFSFHFLSPFYLSRIYLWLWCISTTTTAAWCALYPIVQDFCIVSALDIVYTCHQSMFQALFVCSLARSFVCHSPSMRSRLCALRLFAVLLWISISSQTSRRSTKQQTFHLLYVTFLFVLRTAKKWLTIRINQSIRLLAHKNGHFCHFFM